MSVRDNRQIQIIQRWIDNKYVGTLQAVTGFGKTRTAILAISYVLKLRDKARIVVIVPTIYLQNQWKQVLQENNINNIQIVVINTAHKLEIECDLLILDEIHLYGSEQFSNIFINITYKAILGLTATLERADGKEELIKEYCPIIDIVTLEEALENNYISNYKLYNIPVELTKTERLDYIKINKLYGYYEFKLGGRFSAWELSHKILNHKDEFSQEEYKDAIGFIRTVNKRKQFLYNTTNKLDIALQIIDKFPNRKTVIFSESIGFAEKILQKLPNISTIYHSGLGKKQKKENIELFINSDTINILSSVKALDTGMDIPNISLGITCAGSSRSLQAIQRLGRTVRYTDDNKVAIFFNIYLKDSQEEKWIRNKCEGIPNVYWINSLSEII